MIDNDLIKEIIDRADIVQVISSYINVIKKGKSYVAICPFHDDSNPSLHISPEKRIFKCFVCGTGGNAIQFVQKYENIPFMEAARKVAQMSNFSDPRLDRLNFKKTVDPKKDALYSCIDDLAKYYQSALNSEEGQEAMKYLSSRNISSEDIRKYRIGYAPKNGKATIAFLNAKGHSLKSIEDIGIAFAKADNATSDTNAGRVIFPLSSPDGQIIGFSARRIVDDGSSKYVNSPETLIFNKSKTLYNYHNAKESAPHDKYVYVLEGFMDVIALGKAGISSSIALMGTALTKEQIELLRRFNCEIRLCLDGDEAGQRAMMKMVGLLNKAGIRTRIVDYGGDLRDPDDILQEEGKEALVNKMSKLIDTFDFQVSYYENTKKLSDPQERNKVMNYFIPFIRNIKPGIDRDNYIVRLSKATGYEVEAIRHQINLAPAGKKTIEEYDNDDVVSFEWNDYAKTTTRLVGAERAIIYYMLNNYDAISYYEKNIANMYDKVYEEIASYIQEVASNVKAVPDVATLMATIAGDENANSDELCGKIAAIIDDNFHPPYSKSTMDEAFAVMNEEKDRIYQANRFKEELEGKTQDEKAKLLTERSKNVWNKLKRKKGGI